MNADSLDLQDFLDATSNASKRTRLAMIVLVVACVLGLVGFLNSLRAGWMLERLQKAGDPTNPYVIQKLGFEPKKSDPRYINFHSSLSRAYVENALTVRVPFFGVAFDINDLGLLSGIGFVTILLMLRFSLRNEIVSLRLAFKAAMEVGKNNPKQLDTFYDLMAMRMVLTLPNMEDDSIGWKVSRSETLQSISKWICFFPLFAYSLIAYQDYTTQDIGNAISEIRTFYLLIYTGAFWLAIFVLSIWCFQKLRKIDTIWHEYWTIIHPTEPVLPISESENVAGA